MNNPYKEEEPKDTQSENVEVSEADLIVNADEQSLEVLENTSSYAPQAEDDGADRKIIALLTGLTDQLKENNRISQERELVIDRLHQENQQLKQGELQQALLPIFRDLIRFYDDLNLTVSHYADNAAVSGEKVFKDLNCYLETVSDILYRYGVEQIEVRAGEEFNSKEHKAVAIIPVAETEQDRKISRIIRAGFRTETKIIRNVEVEVFRYAAPTVETIEQNNDISDGEIENQPEVK